jgi:predicted phosphate transport protein (TIGR00153 family)
MSPFQILPAEPKFYDWFERGAQNAVEAATILHTMATDNQDWTGRLAQLTELEHQGDFITHEIFNLLHKTFITPLDPPEIEALARSLDDVVDFIHEGADALLLYQVSECRPYARELVVKLLAATQEIAAAMHDLRDKKTLAQILPRVQEINRLENEADRIYRVALSELVAQRDGSDWFEFARWKDIYEKLEGASDRCEDVADVLRAVVIKYG